MSICDLMFGDWVLWRGTPIKIMSINDKTSRSLEPTVTGLITIDGKETIRRFNAKSLKPIPITLEILAKNADKIDMFYQLGEYPKYMNVMYDSRAVIRILEGDDEYLGIELKNVHELQHALRLYGITEKRIKL